MKHLIDFLSDHPLPLEHRSTVARHIVPSFVAQLEEIGLAVKAGHDLDRIVRFQRAHASRMHLFQLADPACQTDVGADNTLVLVLERGGTDVACVVNRRLWVERSLADEMTSLSLFYKDADFREVGERCLVSASVASQIKACYVAWTAALCRAAQEPSRDGFLVTSLMRLLHVLVTARWRWSWLVCLAEPATLPELGFMRYGFESAHMAVRRTRPGNGGELIKYALMTAPREFCTAHYLDPRIADIAAPIGEAALLAGGAA